MKGFFPLNQYSIPIIALGALLGCAISLLLSWAPYALIILGAIILLSSHFRPHTTLKSIQWFLVVATLFSGYTHFILIQKQQKWDQISTQDTVSLVNGVIQARTCDQKHCTWTLALSSGFAILKTPKISCQVGDVLSTTAKLKKPHGQRNPGGSNREQGAFLKEIFATANTKVSPTCLINDSPNWRYRLLRWRETITDWQSQQLSKDTVGVVQALTMGQKQQIDQSQWEIFRITGTSHLMAISGLHIGLLFLFAFSCCRLVFVFFPQLLQRVPLAIVAGWISFFIALAYAVISGWEIPAQRATAMLLSMLITTTLRLPKALWLGFWLALLMVLFSNPLSLLSPGFWLSFGAVAFLIVMGMGTQPNTSKWSMMLRSQVLLSLALIPLSAAWFGGFSVISPIANLIAIPWVSFGIVPLALIATLSIPFMEGISKALLWLCAWQIEGLMILLRGLSDFHWSYFAHTASPVGIVLALLGALWLTLPKGIPYKPFAFLLWMPFFLQSPHALRTAEARLVLLDVGQGLAMLIQTPHHAILYDTGPKTPYSDAGKDIVLPALNYYGIKHLDHIIISHGDMDHRGGLPAIESAITYDHLLTSNFETKNSEPCIAGVTWSYDDVKFEVLHPTQTFQGKKNNLSCVVLMTIGTHRILLTGDIEKSVEIDLMSQLNNVDILVVPHHGSKTSSSEPFLERLQPKQAWIPVGWKNIYHHPHPSTLARYQDQQIPVWRTDHSGALVLEIERDKPLIQPKQWRHKSLWWEPNLT